MIQLLVFSGNAHKQLGEAVASSLGKSLAKCTIGRFNDGEVNVKIDESVRGKDVYVIQPTCPPVNENLMELLLVVSALRRASAKRVTVVVPYFGYMRSGFDGGKGSTLVTRKSQVISDSYRSFSNTKIIPMFPASDVARMLEVSGINRVVVVDLQMPGLGVAEGFFKKAQVESIIASEVVVENVSSSLRLETFDNLVVISPHSSGISKAKKFRDALTTLLDTSIGLGTIISNPRAEQEESDLELVGNVKDKTVLIVQDIIDSGRSTLNSVAELKKQGAKHIFVYATHALLSGNACEKLQNSQVDTVLVLDTVPITSEKLSTCPKLQQISIAPVLASLIQDLHYNNKT